MSATFKQQYANGRKTWNAGKHGIYSPEHLESCRRTAIKNRMQQKYKDTAIELKVETALKELNLEYIKQFYVPGLLCVDFYVASSNLIIEADGDYWHSHPILHSNGRKGAKKRAIDYARTQTLQTLGYKVLRLWEHEINASTLTQLKQRIKKVL